MTQPEFPFSSVLGQDRIKTALLLAAIAPRLGGVLISGPRGLAKSTLARGLAAIDTRAAGRFVTLPLGATEDQVIGTLDLSKALADNEVAYRPGLIGRAHGGYLYIDEVNLLADALVDVLLDVAASKINRIERDGISREHAADFVLIGTMNPDEGELRPQLSDRFGLCVHLDNPASAAERRAIIDQRLAYEADPITFGDTWADPQHMLAARIEAARERLARVTTPAAIKDAIAERCQSAGVEGVRADLHWRQAASAHAAWHDRDTVEKDDVEAVAEFVLCHRRRDTESPTPPGAPQGNTESSGGDAGSDASTGQPSDGAGDWGGLPPRHVQPTGAFTLSADAPKPPIDTARPPTTAPTGRRKGQQPSEHAAVLAGAPGSRIDWFRTLAVSRARSRPSFEPIHRPSGRRETLLDCVLLDTSGSTLGNEAQARTRAAVIAIAEQAYRARRLLGVLSFGGEHVDWVVPPRRAPRDIAPLLAADTAGGGTPLRTALLTAHERLARTVGQRPGLTIRTWLMTDGRCRDAIDDIDWPWELIVVDNETARVPLGRARRIAETLAGRYIALDDLGRVTP